MPVSVGFTAGVTATRADMKHDGPRFEEHKAVFLKDRHLPEGLQGPIFRLVLVPLFQEARLVRQSGFLQRPAYPKDRVPGLVRSLGPI